MQNTLIFEDRMKFRVVKAFVANNLEQVRAKERIKSTGWELLFPSSA